jgi:RimJ/RimL family protein N-acetyltransferase
MPGRFVKTFRSKHGEEIIIRYPMWEDLDELIRFINKISKEDTYITFSGEAVSRDEEIAYLNNCFRNMKHGNSVHLYATCGAQVIGTCSVERVFLHRQRAMHVGTFGITLEKEFRGKGIGQTMAETVIEEAKNRLRGIEMLTLDVYSENEKAIKMYEKLGFKKAGVIPNGLKYKNRYLDEVKMYLPLFYQVDR